MFISLTVTNSRSSIRSTGDVKRGGDGGEERRREEMWGTEKVGEER